jgi:hypothetical protein
VSSWLGLRVKLSATTKQQAYPGTAGHFVDYLDTNERKNLQASNMPRIVRISNGISP